MVVGNVNFQIDRESIVLHEPTWLNGKIRIDAELVLKCQRSGGGKFRGVKLGKLSDLWPHASLRRAIQEQSTTFLNHMRLQGFEPKNSVYELEVWGPYREKVDMGTKYKNIEEGNEMFFPDGRWAIAQNAAAPAQKGPMELSRDLLDHPDMKRGVHYIVRGLFLAEYGKEEEETGTLIV